MDKHTEPDYESVALLTIDLQNGFSMKGAICEIAGTVEIIPNILKILKKIPIKELINNSHIRLCKKMDQMSIIAEKNNRGWLKICSTIFKRG